MRSIFLLTVGFIIGATAVSAQTGPSQAASPTWKFRSDNYVGLSAGEWGNYGLLQTVNGVARGSWFLGLGAGLDNYRFQSAPMFVSLTRDLPGFTKKGAFFLNVDYGTNLPLYKREFLPYYAMTSKFHAGTWYSGGVGYKWRLSARTDKALLLSVNYSEKRLTENQTTPPPTYNCDPGSCPITNLAYIYDYLNRIFLFKIGFQF